MKNADLPAYPTNAIDTAISHDELTGGGRYLPSNGLTKREMFAMHAPECPEWYLSKFVSDNCQVKNNGMYDINYKFFDSCVSLNLAGQMKLLKQWRYAYADLMLGEDE